jgi:LPS O-antigen subunit length determinant protein (WzzB/FepE family)
MEKIDSYTKVILTVIAIALCAIAIKLFYPQTGSDNLSTKPPTFGDIRALREIKDSKQRTEARSMLLKNIPLIYVYGGDVAVSGSVNIDNL